MASLMQRLIRGVYPPQCVNCAAPTKVENGLCGACWPDVHFIHGASCDLCGVPLLGHATEEAVHCDDCLALGRPWGRGRAAIAYRDVGRRLVLGLKHGDRTDLVPAMAGWMCHAGRDVLSDDPVLVPVPLHRFRLLKRKFNQAAELAKAIQRQSGSKMALTALQRVKHTQQLGVSGVDDRFAELNEAIQPNPKARSELEGQNVVLVDDVMTSGATLSACTEACFAMGAKQVSILVLARATKDA